MPNGSYWPSGKMIGGSGSVNAMLYVRGNSRDYDRWEEMGNPGWGWKTALKYFKKSEDQQQPSFLAGGNEKFHATGGPLKVGSYMSVDPLKYIIAEAAIELGYKEILDTNGETYIGFATPGGTLHEGRRWSPAKAFLNPAKDRPNLHIIKHATATKVEIDENKVSKGVHFVVDTPIGKKEMFAKARKDIIVSSGAVNSAKLLLLSGVGPKEHLEEHKIPLIKDLQVGENLQDHIIVPLFYTYHKTRSHPFDVKEFVDNIYAYVMHQVGPFSCLGAVDMIVNLLYLYFCTNFIQFFHNRDSLILKTKQTSSLTFSIIYSNSIVNCQILLNISKNLVMMKLLTKKLLKQMKKHTFLHYS